MVGNERFRFTFLKNPHLVTQNCMKTNSDHANMSFEKTETKKLILTPKKTKNWSGKQCLPLGSVSIVDYQILTQGTNVKHVSINQQIYHQYNQLAINKILHSMVISDWKY